MDAILKFFIGSHSFLILAIYLFSNGPEGLILLTISIFWLGFELFLITGLINQLLLKNEKKGSIPMALQDAVSELSKGIKFKAYFLGMLIAFQTNATQKLLSFEAPFGLD